MASDAPALSAIQASSTMDAITESVNVDEQSTADVRRQKRRVWKNVILISIAFLFNFNAFQGLSRLQSTLNMVEAIGVITQCILYVMLMISCMFVPKLMIRFIGHRWTMVASFVGYIAYMAANGYAVWGTMITASLLVGLCAAPLWTAQCSYFIIISQHYQRLTGQNSHILVSKFFGLFFMFFQACELHVTYTDDIIEHSFSHSVHSFIHSFSQSVSHSVRSFVHSFQTHMPIDRQRDKQKERQTCLQTDIETSIIGA